MEFRYFRPKSVTWWAGIASIAIAMMQISGIESSVDYAELGRALSILTGGGDSSPASLIVIGAGIIGLGDKQRRSEIVQKKMLDRQ